MMFADDYDLSRLSAIELMNYADFKEGLEQLMNKPPEDMSTFCKEELLKLIKFSECKNSLISCREYIFPLIKESIASDPLLHNILTCHSSDFENTNWHSQGFHEIVEYLENARDFIFVSRFLHFYNHNVKPYEEKKQHLPIFWIIGDDHLCSIAHRVFENFGQKALGYVYVPLEREETEECVYPDTSKVINQAQLHIIFDEIEHEHINFDGIFRWTAPEKFYELEIKEEDLPLNAQKGCKDIKI